MKESIVIREFIPSDLDAVAELVYGTIETSYAGIYGPESKNFFVEYHSLDNILNDASNGYTVVALYGTEIVGTGTLLENDIRRVFIKPCFQGKGLGKLIMHTLEKKAADQNLDFVGLSASYTAKPFYEALGYEVTLEGCDLIQDEKLKYYEMVKYLK